MALFWEFFSFELKYRLKSLSTWVYFGMWFLLSFLAIAAEDFITTGNGKQLLNGPILHDHSLYLLHAVRNDHHRSHFRHVYAARLPARHPAAHLHQADHEVRLSRRPLGRVFRHLRLCFFRHGDRRSGGHAGAVGGSHAHRQRPRLVVLATFPIHRGCPDLFSGLVVLYGRRAVAQDLRRVPARRGCLHDVPDCQRDLLLDAVARTFLVRHLRPSRPAVSRRVVAVLDGGGEKHVALLLVDPGQPRGVSLQPAFVVIRWRHRNGNRLSIFSYVGRISYGRRTGASCGEGQAGGGRVAAAPVAGRSAVAERASALRRQCRL